MKVFKKSLLAYLALGILVTYAFGWSDIISNGLLTGDITKDLTKSIEYYFGWVLVYWWMLILGVSLLLATVTALICNYYYGIKND